MGWPATWATPAATIATRCAGWAPPRSTAGLSRGRKRGYSRRWPDAAGEPGVGVAKINPIKVKQDADKLEKAGKVDQAIVLYRQLVEDNPRDWNTIKKIGDLYVRLNRNKEAI